MKRRGRNSHTLLVGRQNGAATLEDSLAVTYKTKPILSMLLRDHGPCGEGNGNALMQGEVYTSSDSSELFCAFS